MAAFEVLPVNVQVLDLFLAVQTQWRKSPASGRATGIEYPSVKAAMDMMGISSKEAPELFEGLQVMELAALSEMSKETK